MKVHRHVGVVQAVDEITLREALALAAVQHEVLSYLAPNVAVLERDHARLVAEALRQQGFHPRVND